MRKTRILTYIGLLVLFATPFWGAQYGSASGAVGYYAVLNDSILPQRVGQDSLGMSKDSLRTRRKPLAADSIKSDTLAKNDVLDAIVDYKSSDSIVLTHGNWGYLYGDAHVDYSEIKLTGEIISMNMDSSIVEARFGLDSIGKEMGYPIFTDGGTDYETKVMKYNFKTKKGFSQYLITEQGEGYVKASIAKKNADNTFYMRDGMYTTCDEHDHPHFYLKLTKAKVHPKKNVVTGPAYLVIEGLHIPFIGLPFGFFPFTDSYSSGVIMPSYGDEMERGFNLHDGGYYFALNDHLDLKLLGTIYTKGSWGLNAQSTYRKRYKFSGNVNIGYQVSKYGDKGLPDYTQTKDFQINWSHTQDPKMNMFRTFNANVAFTTQSYNRNQLNQQFTSVPSNNTKSSAISLTQRFPNSPWSLSANASVSQVTRNKSMSITFPNLTVSMSRIHPFKRKEATGSEKWFEKIQMSYTGDFRNSINTTEDNPSFALNNWDNAAQHTIPISATFSLFDYLNITPSIQYTERWYTKKQRGYLRSGKIEEDTERISTFKRVYDFSASLGLQTKLYGFYTPLFSKSTKIRHVFTPSMSFTMAPDFSKPMWGYYETLYGYDVTSGLVEEYKYSPFRNQMFGVPGTSGQGSVNFDLQNNIEMKIASEKDSTGYKKISLIDNLGINFSYNTQAERFRWSNINTNIRFKFSKSLTVNLTATFDPYLYDYTEATKDLPQEDRRLERVDKMRIGGGRGGLAKLVRTGYTISPTINQDTFNKWFGRDEKKKEENNSEEERDNATQEKKRLLGGSSSDSDDEYDSDGYLKNEIKWSLGFSFGMNYAMNTSSINHKIKEYNMKLSKTLTFNGSIQPTKNWSLGFTGGYDFEMKKIPHMSCNITRNLHCWSISGSFTPVGPYKSYYVSLRASSSLLQDLKHDFKGRSSSYDPDWD